MGKVKRKLRKVKVFQNSLRNVHIVLRTGIVYVLFCHFSSRGNDNIQRGPLQEIQNMEMHVELGTSENGVICMF